jgi:hypothetical protein
MSETDGRRQRSETSGAGKGRTFVFTVNRDALPIELPPRKVFDFRKATYVWTSRLPSDF